MARFLLLGYGSIGRKHADTLRAIGHEVVTVDPNPDAGADWQSYTHPSEMRWDGLLDCTPPDVRAGWDAPGQYRAKFIEKPLGKTHGWTGKLMMGFCYRWNFTLEDFVQTVQSKGVAELHLVGGQHIQQWHREDYRDVAYRYHGVATDSLPHSIYIARWIMGDVTYQGSTRADVGGLGLGVEDTAAVLLSGPEGQPVLLSANYLQQVREFNIYAVTYDNKKVPWTFDAKHAGAMYYRQMDNFVKLCQGQDIGYYPNLEDGIKVQEVLNAITA